MTAHPAARSGRATPVTDSRLLPIAWAVVVALTVPEIVLRAFIGIDTAWMLPARIVALAVALAATWGSSRIRPLRGMLMVLLVVYAVEGWLLLTVVPQLPAYRATIAGDPGIAFLGERVLRLCAVAVMLAVLLVAGFRRLDVFLAIGDLGATAEPIGVPRSPEPWTRFGRNYALISVGLLLVPPFPGGLHRVFRAAARGRHLVREAQPGAGGLNGGAGGPRMPRAARPSRRGAPSGAASHSRTGRGRPRPWPRGGRGPAATRRP
jgi:hypothetical protein